MTNLILPRRRKLIASAAAAGLAAASPAMGHNGGPPITDGEVRAAIEDVRRVGIELPWGSLPTDPTLAMFMLAKTSNMLVGGADAAAVLKPQDVFAVSLYTGSGSSQTITTGIDMQTHGGMVWGKDRTVGDHHSLYDTLRGVNQRLASSLSSGTLSYTDTLTAFGPTGFSLGADSNGAINGSGNSQVAWSNRVAVKAFDQRQVSHTNGVATNIDLSSLGVVGFALAKISNTSGGWLAWSRSLTAANNLRLQSTAAQSTTDAWLSVSGTTLTISASAPSGTYIIYGWAHDTDPSGIVLCGSFTTDGSGDGSFATGWGEGAQFAKIKCSTATGNWEMFDTARTPGFSGDDARLKANLYDAEDTVSRISQSGGTLSFAGLSASQTYIGLFIRAPI